MDWLWSKLSFCFRGTKVKKWCFITILYDTFLTFVVSNWWRSALCFTSTVHMPNFHCTSSSNFINTVCLYVTLSLHTNRNRKRIGNCFLSSIFWIQWHWTKWRYWRVALKVSPPVTNYKHWKRLWHFCCCCCCYFRPFCAEALAAGFSFCVKQSQALCPFFKSLSGPSLIGTQVCQCEQDGHVTYQHHCSGTVCVMHQENKLSLMKSWCYLSVL